MATDAVVRRDQIVILAALAALTGISWFYLIHDAVGSSGVPACCALPDARFWGWSEFFSLSIMWTVMMVGMMAPTVAPMALVFAKINRNRRAESRPYVATGMFLFGYLLIWTIFSLAASGAQWGLHRTALMSPEMIASNRWLGAGLLVAAGVFQWTPAKSRCLGHCRSPMEFMLTEWREGTGGAIVMGLRHGVFCTGCCWLLMALLFVVGVMNLLWVALITLFVLAEKALPVGAWFSRATGAVLIIWGILILR